MSIDVQGMVLWSDNKERVADAEVIATQSAAAASPSGAPAGPPAAAPLMARVRTDANGAFTLLAVEPGTWEFVVLHQNATPETSRTVELAAATDVTLEIRRYLGGADEKAGRTFFVVLCISLILFVALYLGLHAAWPDQNPAVSEILLSQVSRAEDAAAASETPKENPELVALVADARATWNTIKDTQAALGPADQQVVTETLAAVAAAIAANDPVRVRANLASLRRMIENPPSAGLFWTREPFRYLEVFFWGLAGTLVALILSVGNYLRGRRFYREGIWQHVAQVVTIPLMALVFVLLLSQVTLSLTLANSNEVKIDLSNPRLLVAVAFLIGVQPWNTWAFLRETAGQLTGRQKR